MTVAVPHIIILGKILMNVEWRIRPQVATVIPPRTFRRDNYDIDFEWNTYVRTAAFPMPCPNWRLGNAFNLVLMEAVINAPTMLLFDIDVFCAVVESDVSRVKFLATMNMRQFCDEKDSLI